MSGGLSSLVGPGLTGLATTFLAQQSDRKKTKDQLASQERIAFAQISASQNFQKQVVLFGGIGLAVFLFVKSRGK